MATDDGQGFEQPIMERGEFAIFEVEGGYVVRQFGAGDVREIPDSVGQEFWDAMREAGWEDAL